MPNLSTLCYNTNMWALNCQTICAKCGTQYYKKPYDKENTYDFKKSKLEKKDWFIFSNYHVI